MLRELTALPKLLAGFKGFGRFIAKVSEQEGKEKREDREKVKKGRGKHTHTHTGNKLLVTALDWNQSGTKVSLVCGDHMLWPSQLFSDDDDVDDNDCCINPSSAAVAVMPQYSSE